MRRAAAGPLAVLRVLFWLALCATLVCLLAPANAVLAAKVWAASWLPMAATLDAMDATTYSDKLVHASMFALLGWLGARSWLLAPQRWRLVIGLLLLGVLTEALQSLIPGRSASLGDWLADALGVAAGLLLWPPAAVAAHGTARGAAAASPGVGAPPVLRGR